MKNTKITKTQQEMLDLLEETANHYNSKNRSLEFDAERKKSCVYVPEDTTKSEGCAIGRKLTEKTKRIY